MIHLFQYLLEFAHRIRAPKKISLKERTKSTFLRIGVVDIIVGVDPQKRRFRKVF